MLLFVGLLMTPQIGAQRCLHSADQCLRDGWIDASTLTVLGRGFAPSELLSPWDRLPASAAATVTSGVWEHSRDSAGLAVEFESNATTLGIAFELTRTNTALWHTPESAASAVDLAAWDFATGKWRFVSHSTMWGTTSQVLVAGLEPPPPSENSGQRFFRLHFPLHNGVSSVLLLASADVEGAAILPSTRWLQRADGIKRVVWYGTSLVQSAGASRPGNGLTNVVRNALSTHVSDVDVVNLGFNGHGHMDLSVGALIGQVQGVVVVVVDCLPNLRTAEEVSLRVAPLARQLRTSLPGAHLVFADEPPPGSSWILNSVARIHADKTSMLRRELAALVEAGDDRLHYVSNTAFFARLGDGGLDSPTADGVHLTDAGIRSLAAFWVDFLLPLIIPDQRQLE